MVNDRYSRSFYMGTVAPVLMIKARDGAALIQKASRRAPRDHWEKTRVPSSWIELDSSNPNHSVILAKPSNSPGALWRATGPHPGPDNARQRLQSTLESSRTLPGPCQSSVKAQSKHSGGLQTPLRLRAKPGDGSGALYVIRAPARTCQSLAKAPGLSGEKRTPAQAPAKAQ